MQYLRYNDSVKVVIGPFVDYQDGVSMEAGVTLTGADQACIIKHDNGTVVDITGGGYTWAAITGANGYYHLTLTDANLDTPGMLTVAVADADVCLPVRNDFHVVSGMDNVLHGQASSADTTTFNTSLTTDYGFANNSLNGRTLIFDRLTDTAALRGVARTISGYANTNGAVTLDTALPASTASGDFFYIL